MNGYASPGRAASALVLGALLILVAAIPVAAQQYSTERYEWTETGEYECGEGNWIDWTASGSGVFSIRTGTGKDASAFFAHDRYEWQSIDTRRSDGVSLHFSGHGNFIETKATRVSGSVFQFTAVDAGRPFMVTDDDGNVLARDRGSIRQSILFDTLGDDMPGGTFIEDVSFRTNGPHPGLEFDACDYLG